MTKQSKFPEGWDQARVRRVLDHYESQSEEEAVAEVSVFTIIDGGLCEVIDGSR